MAELKDQSGTTVFKGTGTGFSGAPPVQAYYTGDGAIVTDGNSAHLPFTNLADGVELLDRTDPATPVFLADGTYALTLYAGGSFGQFTAAGYAALTLHLPTDDVAANITSAPAFASGPTVVLAAVYRATAGASLYVAVANNDGAASREFAINQALLVKIA